MQYKVKDWASGEVVYGISISGNEKRLLEELVLEEFKKTMGETCAEAVVIKVDLDITVFVVHKPGDPVPFDTDAFAVELPEWKGGG